jgi:hypothetical protein
MKKVFSRRNVLRGAGVCLALPWLESLAPRGARAQAAAIPKRYVPIYFPNGAAVQWWENAPAFGTSVFGEQFILSSVHEPLLPVKQKLLILSRMANYTWKQGQGTNPDFGVEPSHSRCPGALMTCVDTDALATAAGMQLPSAVINGVSADQVMVQQGNFGQLTPIESMQVGCGSFPGAFDGRSYSYSQVMSWKSAQEPLKRQINPKAVFDAMVNAGAMNSDGAADPAADALAQQRAAENKSVLDAVLENSAALRPRLSRQDQQTLEQFETSFREIEKAVTNVTQTINSGCQVTAEPGSVPEPPGSMQGLNQGQEGYDRAAHMSVMNDLVVMALQCDVTRIITYMLDDSRSEFNYSFIPAEDAIFGSTGGIDNFHGGAQHGSGGISGTAENGVYPGESNGAFATIDRWLVRKVSELAQKLDAIQEGDGTVLDHTLLHMMSAMRTHDHDAYDLPMLMIGGTGFIKQDGHIALAAYPSDRQLRDLFYTIQTEYFGLGVTAFGDDMRGAQNEVIADFLI